MREVFLRSSSKYGARLLWNDYLERRKCCSRAKLESVALAGPISRTPATRQVGPGPVVAVPTSPSPKVGEDELCLTPACLAHTWISRAFAAPCICILDLR